jgi:hypothetical protein
MSLQLRKTIGREEFDYNALMAALDDYAHPHDKITRLLRDGTIVRVKKGIYVFGDDYRRRPYSREVLANLVYGPSFVSLDYALGFHGLIPERVEQVTSVVAGRGKLFETPVGVFVYRPTPLASFYLGMSAVTHGDISYLIATPERALADKVREDRSSPIRSMSDAEQVLFENLRVDEERFRQLRGHLLHDLADALSSRKVQYCAELLDKMGGAR